MKLENKGLWNDEGYMEIQYGEESSDDGFLTPDEGTKVDSKKVKTVRLDEYVAESNIEEINLLKVEAEGAEPEVLEGIGDLEIDNIVVVAAPERDGNAVGEKILNILQP